MTQRKSKRGRSTLLTPQLQKEICRYLSDCCTIRTACEATAISETSFFGWIRRGEADEQPFAQFAQAVTRARGRAKARIVRSLLDEKDWRPRLEVLARVFPDEYGRRETAPLPPQSPEPLPPLSEQVVCVDTTTGIDLAELDRLKAQVQDMEQKLGLNFPTIEIGAVSPAPADDNDL